MSYDQLSLEARLASLPEKQRVEMLDELFREVDPIALMYSWEYFGRPSQIEATDSDAHKTLVLAGRGFGKTRVGSEWTRKKTRGSRPTRGFLAARTASDVRDTLIQGEALALDTAVPTPRGWTTMGDLQPGDEVIGGSGAPCRVVRAFPVLEGRPCYVVRFRSGAEIVADADHKWLTTTSADRRYEWRHGTGTHGPRVRTTAELAATVRAPSGWNHGVDMVAVEFGRDGADDKLPVDPYVLGAWLGGGHSREGSVTIADTEAGEMIAFLSEHYAVRPRARKTAPCAARDYGLAMAARDLRSAGVLGNKHIPVGYMRASRAARLALLQGMMDTDGSAQANEWLEFSNSREVLIDGFVSLANSLGIKARKAPHGAGWRVQFQSVLPAFRLSHKLRRQMCRQPKQQTYDAIVAVDPVPSVLVRCIEVDDLDRTFMVTDRYKVTHNSGILNIFPPSEMPRWVASQRTVFFANGSTALCLSAKEPDQARGPQAEWALCDEWATWDFSNKEGELDLWDNIQIATRLGTHPQIMLTTTPKRIKQVREIVKVALAGDAGIKLIRGSMFENVALSGQYLDTMVGLYGGSRLGLQELYAQLLDETEGALWKEAQLGMLHIPVPGKLSLRVVGVDPSVADEPLDECGIIVMGATNEIRPIARRGWVLADRSGLMAPAKWAKVVVEAAHEFDATVIAESNQGGAMVREMIHNVDPKVKVRLVHAKESKKLRAEPVSAVYEQGRIAHASRFVELEEQMTSWVPAETADSPDRIDALVHAATALLLPAGRGSTPGKSTVSSPGRRGTIPTGAMAAVRSRQPAI